MMENITEFIKNFRERMSSPFFFSFVISWIFANWKVTVALLWYNSDLYPKEGDLLRFIDENTSNLQSIYLPLLVAVAYTSVIKNFVSALVSFSAKWGGNWNLNISKGSKIPMTKFLTYRDMYLRANENLEKVIEDERGKIEDYDKERQKSLKLEAENVSLGGEVSKLKNDYEDAENKRLSLEKLLKELQESNIEKEEYIRNHKFLIDSLTEVEFMNGRWKFRYDNTIKDLHYEEIFYIIDGVINTVGENSTRGTYKIKHFFHDVPKNKIFFSLNYFSDSAELKYLESLRMGVQVRTESLPQTRAYFRSLYDPVLIHDLEVRDSSRLFGTENVEARISYERIS